MTMSASCLGKEYGLTGEEMNRVLAKLGFLAGEPGDYELTSKGLQYAVTKDYHRGTGGYAQYNRYWTTRSFDESIKDALDISSELVSEVRKEIADARALRSAARAAARAKADADFLAREAAKKAAELAEQREAAAALKRWENWKKVGKIGLVIAGGVAVGYGVYKAVPRVKQWLNKQKETEENSVETSRQKGDSKLDALRSRSE